MSVIAAIETTDCNMASLMVLILTYVKKEK